MHRSAPQPVNLLAEVTVAPQLYEAVEDVDRGNSVVLIGEYATVLVFLIEFWKIL